MMAGYDDYAKEFSDQRAGASLNRLIEEPVIHELIGIPTGLRVLDAGCGDGSYCRWLVGHGATPIGLDASAELIRIAQSKNDSIRYDVHDLSEPLPFEDGSFDLVLCTLVTEYVQDIRKLFLEFARVLRQGGRLVLSIDHPFLSGVEKNDHGERVLTGYFARRTRTYRWFGHEVEVFSHTLEDYVQALLHAKMHIDDLREPTPVKGSENENALLVERASKIPTIMIIVGSKR